MKTITTSVLAVLTLSVVAGAASAQNPNRQRRGQDGQQRPGAERRQGGGAINQRVIEALGLTDEQKTKMTDLVKKQRDEMAALRKKQQEQVMELLTPEQRKKLEELRAQQRNAARGNRPGAPAPAKP